MLSSMEEVMEDLKEVTVSARGAICGSQGSVQKTPDGVCLMSSGILKVCCLPFESVILSF